jgi:hypothetical protein
MFLIIAAVFGVLAGANDNNSALGLQLGWPSGLTARHWTSDTTSLALTGGFSLESEHRFLLSADHLWTKQEAFSLGNETFDFSYGVGLGLRTKSGANRRELVVGPRIPLLISYEVLEPGGEIFLSTAVNGGVLPSFDLYFDFALGFRIYLF